MAVLRGGVIGCGFFAANHLNGWAEIEGVEIVAVCDRDRGRAEAAARRFGIPAVYTDAEAMLAEAKLDFVDIITTVPSHRPLVELAARHRVPTICQKPFAERIEDAEAMVAACRAAGIPLMVHENFRWQSPILAVRRKLAEGAVGRPCWARISFRHAYDIYAGQPYLLEEKRLAIMDIGVHVLDVARDLLGEATRIYCATQRIDPRVAGEDAATVTLTHAGGALSVVDMSFAAITDPDPFPQTAIRIEGTEGTLELETGYRLKLSRRDGSRTWSVEPPVPSWGERPWHVIQDSVVNIQRHWAECLRSGTEPATSGADNLKTLVLAFRAYESAERGQAVAV